jgi:hypothetical protein
MTDKRKGKENLYSQELVVLSKGFGDLWNMELGSLL